MRFAPQPIVENHRSLIALREFDSWPSSYEVSAVQTARHFVPICAGVVRSIELFCSMDGVSDLRHGGHGALASGGSFTTVKPSQHSLTAADIIERFLGRRCEFTATEGGAHLMTIR